MPTPDSAGLTLCRKRGHLGWVSFEQRALPQGFGMCAPCDLGDHWLAEQGDGSLRVGTQSYAWPSAAEAQGARERYRAQQQAKV
jgi:hypothetical protein